MKSSLLEAFDDIYDTWEKSWWQRPHVWLMIVSIVIGLSGLFLVFRYIRKKYFLKSLTRSEVLLKQLATISPLEENEVIIYTLMVNIVQEALESRLNKKAIHLTEEELLPILENYNYEIFITLKPLLERAYIVRFAAQKYPLEDVRTDLAIFSTHLKKLLEPVVHESRF